MLSDIYDILGTQITKLKTRALLDELDGKDAAKLHKYALTLQLLTAEEAKRTESFALGEYSDAELKALVDKSTRVLGSDNAGLAEDDG